MCAKVKSPGWDNSKTQSMRALYFLSLALPAQFLFTSCTTVRKDDHSYTYVYQHNTQTQAAGPSTVRYDRSAPFERPPFALEADTEPIAAGEPDQMYRTAPVQRSLPIENIASGPGPYYEPQQAVYYRMPQPQCSTPMYRAPSIDPFSVGLFFRSGTEGSTRGAFGRPISPSGRFYYNYGQNVSPSLRGVNARGR